MSIVTIWAGSTEFVRVSVTRDGTTITDGVELALVAGSTPEDARPTTWTPAAILDGRTGVLAHDLAPGTYVVWYRVVDAPETPIGVAGLLDVR